MYFVDEIVLFEMNFRWGIYLVLPLDDVREYLSEVDLADNLNQFRIADLPALAEIEVVAENEVD